MLFVLHFSDLLSEFLLTRVFPFLSLVYLFKNFPDLARTYSEKILIITFNHSVDGIFFILLN
jgi:hypothetical protein